MSAGTKVQLRLGKRVVAEVAFQGAELRVGRMKENDLVINNVAVSRFHAVLRRVGDAFELEDLGSENGSFVDGVAVRGCALVPAGASIKIGKHTLWIREGGEGHAQAPLPSKSDVWDAAQTYFAPEAAPRAAEAALRAPLAQEEERVAVAVEADGAYDDDMAVADAIEATEDGAAPLLAPPPRPPPQSLDLPDPDGLFAFSEDDLVGQAAPDPVAASGPDVVVESLAALLAPAPAELGAQTALFDFALSDDLGLSEPSLVRAAAARAPAPARPAPLPAVAAPSPLLHAGLIVERAGRVERVVPCRSVELVAGRAPGCEIVLGSAGVSRRHARFVRDGERYRVLDLGSANGIRVNGERVEARTLEVGDVVGIDEYALTFVVDHQPVDGAVRAMLETVGDAEQHTVFAPAAPATPERDLVLEADDEDAPADWEKQLERTAEVATPVPLAVPLRAAIDSEWVVEVAIATERLPAALRAVLRELDSDELRMAAELRLTRRR